MVGPLTLSCICHVGCDHATVKRVLYVANAGDARCVISRNGVAERLSVDHKPNDEAERQRIEGSGGFILNGRVNGTLRYRSSGDAIATAV